MVDAYSETWIEVRDRAVALIDAARSRLEQVDQSQNESQFLRGKIAACREILAMAQPKPVDYSKAPEELKARDRSGI